MDEGRRGRVFVVVLDGVGAGELPDAGDYGDVGSHTLQHVAEAVGGMRVPTLASLGLGNLASLAGVPPSAEPLASWGRLREASPGKDSVTGHWEMMGVVLERPFPTYPAGFPDEIIRAFEDRIGMRTLGNVPTSGTEIVARLGDEHVRTGRPIVYTSADSVFQIAAHERVVPPAALYAMCRAARALLQGEHAVGRVIARPFEGAPGAYHRTAGRRDFPLEPPANALDDLCREGRRVHSIGRIAEFFSGRGIASHCPTTCNAEHVAAVIGAARTGAHDLVFANLEDFDMLYGHRNDAAGFARALEEFDASLPELLSALRPADVLMLTSDHGNDPVTPSTDHSREHAFVLLYAPARGPSRELGLRHTFADIGATVADLLEVPIRSPGRTLLGPVAAAGEGTR